MAGDDKVYKLTWIFEGQKFTAEINATTANAISKISDLESADVRLTNVKQTNTRKRTDASTQETASTTASAKAQIAAVESLGSSFAPATQRVVTYTSTLNRQLSSVESKLSTIPRGVRDAQSAIASLDSVMNKATKGSEQAALAADLLARAHQRLADEQDKASLSANNNLSALEQAARGLRDQIDPLSAAQREYNQAVSVSDQLLSKHRITQGEFNDSIRLAKSNFETTAAAIRKEAESTYNALIAANKRYQTSIAAGRVSGSTVTGVTQQASTDTLGDQLKTGVVSGQKVDPLTIESTKQLTDELNRLAAEEEEASVAAQRLKDSLDPIAAVERELSASLMGYLDLLGRGKLSIEEYTAAQKRAKDAAQIKVERDTGVTKYYDDLARKLQELTAKFDPATTSARRMGQELAAVDAVFKGGLISKEKYLDLNNKIIQSHDLGAVAAKRYAEEQAKLIAGARAEQTATNAQERYNLQSGVVLDTGRSAQESAAFFEELAAAEKEVADASDTVASRVAELTSRFDPATTSAGELAREIGLLKEAQRLGVNISGGYDAALDKLYRKFGQLTQAELDLQRVQSRSFTGTSATANVTRRTATTDESITSAVRERDLQTDKDNVAANNELLGVNDRVTNSARESAEAINAEMSAIENMSIAVDRLRGDIDPLSVAQQRFSQSIKQIDFLRSKLTVDEYNTAIRQARTTFETTAAAIRRESKTTYDALVEATNRYKTATLTTSTNTTRNTNVTTGETLQSQINVANPAVNDPRTLEMSREYTVELNKMSAAAESASIEARKLVDSLNPVAAIEREAGEATARYTALLNSNNISLKQHDDLVEKLNRTKRQRIDEVTGVTSSRRDDSEASQKSFDDYNRLATAANRYKEQLNPLIDVQRKYRERISEIRELTSMGLLTNQQATASLGTFVEKEELVTAALKRSEDQQLSAQQITKRFSPILRQAAKDHVDFASTSNQAFGLNRIGMLELQAAGINTFQALAAGMDPLHVATMEGSQAIGAFVQGGLSIKTLLGIVAPLGALAVAIAAVGTRIIGVNINLKEFGDALDLIGAGSNQTPESLQKIIENLRLIGVSAGDSKKALAEVFKAVPEGLNLDFSERILKASLDISKSPFSSGDLTANVEALTQALTGGVEGLEKYGQSINALGPAEIREMDRLNRIGETSKAVLFGFKAIESFYSGTYTRSLTKFDLLIISIVNSWTKFIDALSKTQFATDAIDALDRLGDKIKYVVDNLDLVYKWFVDNQDYLGKQIDRLTGGGLVKRIMAIPVTIDKEGKTTSTLGDQLKGGVDTNTGFAKTIADAWNAVDRSWEDLEASIKGGLGLTDDLSKTTYATKELATALNDNKRSLDSYNTALAEGRSRGRARVDVVGDTATAAAPTPSITYSTGLPRLAVSERANVDMSDTLKKLRELLSEGSKSLPEGYRSEISSGFRRDAKVEGTGGTSLHSVREGGGAIDVKLVGPEGVVKGFMGADVTGAYNKFERAVEAIQKDKYPELTGKMQFGTKFKDSGHFGVEGGRGYDLGLSPAARTAGTTDDIINKTNLLTAAQTKLQEDLKRTNDATRGQGVELVKAQAYLQAYNTELAAGRSQADAVAMGNIAASAAVEALGIEWEKNAKTAKTLADNTVLTTDEYKKNEVAGIQQAAMTEAVNESMTGAVDVRQRYNEILTKNATEAILNSQKESTAFGLTLTANQNLAEATGRGTAAAHEADLQNQAVLKTHNSLALAYATEDESLINIAKAQQVATLEQIKANDALTQTITLRQNVNTLRNELQSTQFQTALTAGGGTRDQITAQLENLRAIQYVQQQMADADPKTKQTYLDIVDATGRWKIRLAEIEEQQRRINDVIKDIADTIVTELGNAIDDAFDQKKAKSWGERLKDILKDVIKSASESLFLKPVLGSLASSLGFSSAGQSLGSITGSSTTAGALTGGTSAGTTATTAAAGIGGVSLTGALGLGGSTGSTGSVSNWLNSKIGTALGFAPPASTVSTGGLTVGELSDLGLETGGSLFGSTTLTGALGGAATGFGGGGLVSSLLGGNTTVGSIGGAVGGVAGTLIGGPVGGFVGGALGGLTGLFGNNKKSNDAAGGNLDLTTGKISGTVTSKDAASNQDVKDIGKELADFTKQLKKDTGGTVSDIVSIQSGLRDGIKIGYGGIEKTFTDSQEAIDQLELDIAKNVEGVTDTYKKVIDKITDPADIADALTFIDKYDNLKDAADSAFASIDADTEALGPYALAMEELNDTFDDLTASAEEFGLSLDPINDGLKEATKRLQDDFGKSLDAAFNTSIGKDYVNTLQDVSDAFVSNREEAAAIDLTDTATIDKISKLEVSKARETLDTLTNDELKDAVDALADTAPELSLLAQSIIDAGTAADDTTDALTTLADGLKDIQDLAKSLKTGKLSGLTGAAATEAAIDVYKSDLKTVQDAGDKVTGTQLADLAVSGEEAINASMDAYGNAPKTADLRKQIVKDLASVETTAKAVKDVDKADVTVPAAVKTSQESAVAGIEAKAVLETLTPATIVDAGILDKYIDTVRATDTPKKIADGLRALKPTDATDITLFSTTADYIEGVPSTGTTKTKTLSTTSATVAPAVSTTAAATTTVAPVASSPAIDETDTLEERLTADLASPRAPYVIGNISYTGTGGYSKLTEAAGGSDGTPPGRILVGEIGPEWMGMPSSGGKDWDWNLVGKNGPEIIDQKGGATILPFPVQPKDIVGQYSSGTKDIKEKVRGFSLGTVSNDNMFVPTYKGGISSFVDGTKSISSVVPTSDVSMPSFMGGTDNIALLANDPTVSSYEKGTVPSFARGTRFNMLSALPKNIPSFADGVGSTTVDSTTTNVISMPSFAGGTSNVTVIPHAMRSREDISLPKFMIGTVGVPKFAMGTMNVYNASGVSNIQSFAEGVSLDTTTLPAIADRSFPSITGPVNERDDSSSQSVVNEIRSLHDDLVALKKQVQGGQSQAMTDAKTGNTRLSSIDTKLGSGLVSPTRRAVG